jgi:CubicO group peptidase (beta-lactamase class C family)
LLLIPTIFIYSEPVMPTIEEDILHLLSEAAVPGVAIAAVGDNRPAQYVCCGKRSTRTPEPVDEHIVFEAASLSKPVFAHAVLQLADRGLLSLTAPLGDHLPNYAPIDARVAFITATDVLRHSTGLPNWRSADHTLKTYFERRERFSYSGEGFLYLQKVVEAITGESTSTLIDHLVLEPLAMTQSSFVWHPRLGQNRALPHDAFGKPALSYKPGEANAAWSLQTTASDFARFLMAVLNGSQLKTETARLWLRPHMEVKHHDIQSLGPRGDDVATGVAWGLGWGLEVDAGTFFHWGDNGPFTAFTIGSVRQRDAVVIFTNGASGLSIMPELIAHFMPGDRPSLAWLDYVRHQAPVRRMLRAALAQGIRESWSEADGADLGQPELQWIAQGLSANGREADSLWVRAKIDERSSTVALVRSWRRTALRCCRWRPCVVDPGHQS